MKLASITLFVAALLLGSPVAAQTLRAHTTDVGSGPNTVTKLVSRYAGTEGIYIQVSEGQVMTRSMFTVANGGAEIISAIIGQYARLATGTGPFADMSTEAQAAATRLRSVFSFPVGATHILTWDGNGIESLDDIAGHRVYTGPGGGGASVDNEELIEILTGLHAGTDYEAVRMPWGEGMQAMRNGQVDVMFRIAPVGAAIIQEFGLSRPIRLLGFDEEDVGTAAFEAYMSVPGRTFIELPPGTYEGQVNQTSLELAGFSAAIAVNADVDEDTVYRLTRSFWSNLAEIQAAAIFMRAVTLEHPFTALNMPLHPGAIRYYEEVGVAIPDALRP